jgi:DNA-binding response OmpR family regulator
MKPSKILLVEDHEDTRAFIVFVLEQAKYQVFTSDCIAEALILAKQEHPDLFVLDSLLPDGNGVELCKCLHELTPKTPILFCSARAYEADKQEALLSGALAYLVKPVDLNLLRSTVAELLMLGESGRVPATVF